MGLKGGIIGNTLEGTHWEPKEYIENLRGTHWEPKEHIENLMGTHWEHVGNKGKKLGVGMSQILPDSLVLNTMGKQPGMPHTINARLNATYLLTSNLSITSPFVCDKTTSVISKAPHIAMVGSDYGRRF
jgi:hypothetical protein